MSNVILKIEKLSKKFKDVKAVDNISFEVKKGELFCFLGPNGAGKSTTIKMMTTLLKQDSGSIFLNGKNNGQYIREKIGVVFQENICDDLLTVKENLFVRGALYIKDNKQLKTRYEELKKEFSLEEIENKKFKFLSGGQKRRVEIARALLANPEVLLLDEPTTGLDPESRRVVWNIINKLKESDNLTVVLTTHYMEETNDADNVVIINKGKIVANGSPSKLKNKYAHNLFKIVPKDKNELINYLTSKNLGYENIAEQIEVKIENYQLAIKILKENELNINSFEFIKGSMDDVFLNIVGEKIIWEKY